MGINEIPENLTQQLCDCYLCCPQCRGIKSLRLSNQNTIECVNCNKKYQMKHGIPALMDEKDFHLSTKKFLGISGANKERFPYKLARTKIYKLVLSEILYGLCALYFLYKYGFKRLLKREWSHEVCRALYYGWRNYFNLILKGGEIVHFNKIIRYMLEPSLEIGCGSNYTTNMIFRDKLKSVTFGCEYFMDTYLHNENNQDSQSKLSPEMFKLIRHYIGGSIKSLPFISGVFNSVYMVHIIDHIAETDQLFEELKRILRPGGYLIMSGYSKYVFEHLPGVKLRRFISKTWAERYKIKRITRENPHRGGIPLGLKNDYYSTGMNILSIDEWKKLAGLHEFELIEYNFFGHNLSFFMDFEYRGYFPSFFFNEIIYSAISEMLEDEKNNQLIEENSTNVVLVFKKA